MKVAIIDTGVDMDHWDLAANLLSGWNVIDQNSNVEETAANSHGTAIAGIIAAVGNNGFDVNENGAAGVTWKTKVLPVLFCDLSQLPNTIRGCTDSALAEGIQFARNNGVKIVNVSSNFTIDIPQMETCFSLRRTSRTRQAGGRQIRPSSRRLLTGGLTVLTPLSIKSTHGRFYLYDRRAF